MACGSATIIAHLKYYCSPSGRNYSVGPKGGERQPLKSQFHNANVHGLRGNGHNA